MGRFLIVLTLLLVGETLRVATLAAATDRTERVQAAIAAPGARDRAQESGAGRPAGGTLTSELMGKTIHTYLEGEWGRRVKDLQVAVLEPSDPIGVPPGKVEVQVVPTPHEEGVGRRMFQIAVTAHGKPWKTIEVFADVTAMIDAIVLNRFVKPEEVIDASDLKMAQVRISQLAHPFITDRDEVVGKSAARPLPADTPLRAVFLKAPVVIKKGDRVMIEAKRGGLSIQTYGVTKSSGHVGQTIMVSNPDSGRELRAKIVAPGLVQVEF